MGKEKKKIKKPGEIEVFDLTKENEPSLKEIHETLGFIAHTLDEILMALRQNL